MQQVRAQACAKYTDLRVSVRNVPSFNIGGGNFDIDFVIRGPELEALAELRRSSCASAARSSAASSTPTPRSSSNKPELRVEIDRERAADLGVDTSDIAPALRLMVGGDEEVSRFRDAAMNEDYDVQLRLIERDRERSPTRSPGCTCRAPQRRAGAGSTTCASTRCSRGADSPSRIDRLDRQRQVSLRAGVAPGYALADRLEALRRRPTSWTCPPAYTTSVTGRGRELERTFSEFIWAFMLSIIFMYMILASQFESLIHPLTILLSLPLSVPFALLSLWATGNTLNLYSALGILVLFGVVKKNSILQIDHMNKLRRAGHGAHAGHPAGQPRPAAADPDDDAGAGGRHAAAVRWARGPGAEERRAIAVVVIGGQTLSLLLTLIVTPVAYSLFDDLRGQEKVGGLVRRILPKWGPKRERRRLRRRRRRGVALGILPLHLRHLPIPVNLPLVAPSHLEAPPDLLARRLVDDRLPLGGLEKHFVRLLALPLPLLVSQPEIGPDGRVVPPFGPGNAVGLPFLDFVTDALPVDGLVAVDRLLVGLLA